MKEEIKSRIEQLSEVVKDPYQITSIREKAEQKIVFLEKLYAALYDY